MTEYADQVILLLAFFGRVEWRNLIGLQRDAVECELIPRGYVRRDGDWIIPVKN